MFDERGLRRAVGLTFLLVCGSISRGVIVTSTKGMTKIICQKSKKSCLELGFPLLLGEGYGRCVVLRIPLQTPQELRLIFLFALRYGSCLNRTIVNL